MKKYLIILILIIFTIIICLVITRKQNPLGNIKKFKIYYGKPFDSLNIKLRDYDMAILESQFYSKDKISEMKSKNDILLIGYLSVFEVSSWDKYWVESLSENEYLNINGEKISNENYGNYIGDITNKKYREVLLELVNKRINEKGFDGVFLDTVDWIDYYKEDNISREMMKGYELFLKELSNEYPELIIIQNRSFYSNKNMSYKYINGFLWENFKYQEIFKEDLDKVLNLLNKQIIYNQKNFTVSHKDYKMNKKWSERFNWIFMENLNRYSEW